MRTPFRPAAVFLDAGNTLLAEHPSRAEIYAEVARAHGLAVDVEELRGRMQRAHAELPREIGPHFRYSEGWFAAFIERVLSDGLGLERRALPAVQAELFARFADPRTFRLEPGARELVGALKARGLVVGVISNWSERLPGLLDGLGLARQLDFAVVSALERCEKPEPRIFELALARAGVAPGLALHAGDDLRRDVHGAQAVGILPVHVDRAGSGPAGPHARVRDLGELKRWILDRLET